MLKKIGSFMVLCLLLIGGLVACGSDSPVGQTCTLLPCPNVLNVVVNAPGVNEYTLLATGSDGDSINVVCGDASSPPGDRGICSSTGVQLLDFTPEEVSLTLISADGRSVTETFRPDYTTLEPNGPGCGTCQQATVTLSLS
ncbi:MAG: hypothetical protein HC921_13355 [Synechococcaceae cyanobacterium SM2_3_1]|nr:hypothetical protein [Synechococcaceae cyanobacterium SM2_3_1]